MHDVVVVGAGPAGSMAAWTLTKAGLDVMVLERRAQVGVPVMCGEAIGSFSLSNNHIPVSDEFFVRRVEGIRIIGPDGTDGTEAMQGLCIRRDRFDQHLSDLATGAGADLQLGTTVTTWKYDEQEWTIATEDDVFKGRVLVAADGPRSQIGHSIGLGGPPRLIKAIQYKFGPSDDLSDDHLRFYVAERYGGGYGWCFDRGTEVNVGVIAHEGSRRLLDTLCKELGLDPRERSSIGGGMVPIGGPNTHISGKAVVTVGDAAGLINPCSAGGIHPALHSGRVAAEHIIRALDEGDPEDMGGYEKEIRSTPFCAPVLQDARALMDELDDEQWDFIIKTLREQDISRLRGMKAMTRLIVDSPFTVTQLRSLRALGRVFRSYGTWGW